jgi:DNA-binding transcriptional ArsR family regulator
MAQGRWRAHGHKPCAGGSGLAASINWSGHLATWTASPCPPCRPSRPVACTGRLPTRCARWWSRASSPHGTRLPAERELAQQLGVSRPSVREALIALEVEGLVEVRMGSGIYVREQPAPAAAVSAEPPLETIRAREVIECELAARAAATMKAAPAAWAARCAARDAVRGRPGAAAHGGRPPVPRAHRRSRGQPGADCASSPTSTTSATTRCSRSWAATSRTATAGSWPSTSTRRWSTPSPPTTPTPRVRP